MYQSHGLECAGDVASCGLVVMHDSLVVGSEVSDDKLCQDNSGEAIGILVMMSCYKYMYGQGMQKRKFNSSIHIIDHKIPSLKVL